MNFPTGYAHELPRDLVRRAGRRGRAGAATATSTAPERSFRVAEPDDSRTTTGSTSYGCPQPCQRPPVSVVYGQGDVFHRNRGRYKIGFTMLEVDGFPAEWVGEANAMDEVWVPSEFNRAGLPRVRADADRSTSCRSASIRDHFHPGVRRVRNPNGDFVFFAHASSGASARSRGCFCGPSARPSDRSEPVRLVCKVINRDPACACGAEIAASACATAAVESRTSSTWSSPITSWRRSTARPTASVAVGRGEGWDMPLMEAMACGLPSHRDRLGGPQEFVTARHLLPAARSAAPSRRSPSAPTTTASAGPIPTPTTSATCCDEVFEHPSEARAIGGGPRSRCGSAGPGATRRGQFASACSTTRAPDDRPIRLP